MGYIDVEFKTVAQTDKGLALLAEAWTITGQNGQRYINSERHRLEGELLLPQTDDHWCESWA